MLTTRTEAPKALGGRFERNFPLTTPDEPCGRVIRLDVRSLSALTETDSMKRSPPDHTNFRALDFPLGFVDVCNTLRNIGFNHCAQFSSEFTNLAKIKLSILLVANALNLNQ